MRLRASIVVVALACSQTALSAQTTTPRWAQPSSLTDVTRPIVHSGLFVGWVHHNVALVAERRLDEGRLLVSTFRLREHLGTHPVATVMMQDMIDRLAPAPAR